MPRGTTLVAGATLRLLGLALDSNPLAGCSGGGGWATGLHGQAVVTGVHVFPFLVYTNASGLLLVHTNARRLHKSEMWAMAGGFENARERNAKAEGEGKRGKAKSPQPDSRRPESLTDARPWDHVVVVIALCASEKVVTIPSA